MQLSRPPVQPTTPVVLDALPNPPLPEPTCPRRTRQQLDLLLLAIEALDIGGSEAMLAATKQLHLQDVIKNRVSFWRLRATNPLRRYSQRRPLSLTEGKALVFMTCHLSRRMTVLIRQLLMVYDQLLEKQLPLEQHIRLATYLERFRAHFRARMNPKRAAVIAYGSDEKLNQLAIGLLGQLLFCTGAAGEQRLWSSLFDGEAS
jgi:Protein of unknown function (DUF3038)